MCQTTYGLGSLMVPRSWRCSRCKMCNGARVGVSAFDVNGPWTKIYTPVETEHGEY
jgi:hypothetical protein